MAVVLVAYAIWFAASYPSSHGGRDYIFLGTRFLRQSHASSLIHEDPLYMRTLGATGYDGQFYYYMALDPLHARYYVDTPGYRYPRVLYPVLARIAAANQVQWLPKSLVLVNWLAAGGGTFFLAAWLKRRRLPPLAALIYGLNPGLFVATTRDLAEPVAYAFVALAVYLMELSGRRRYWPAALAFACAALAREVTIVFALVYGLGMLWQNRETAWRRNVGKTLGFITLSILPYLLYKLALRLWLGSSGLESELSPFRLPLSGLFGYWPWNTDHWTQALCVATPVLLWAAAIAGGVSGGRDAVQLAAFALNALLLVVFLNPLSYAAYPASSRIALGAVLAAVYCLPVAVRARGATRQLLFGAVILWCTPGVTLYLLPVVHDVHHALLG
jgi:hypothetical protein